MMKVHFNSSENEEETVNEITTIGLDTSKQVFHMVGLNQAGKVTLRKQLSRQRLLPFFAQSHYRQCDHQGIIRDVTESVETQVSIMGESTEVLLGKYRSVDGRQTSSAQQFNEVHH